MKKRVANRTLIFRIKIVVNTIKKFILFNRIEDVKYICVGARCACPKASDAGLV
jgi:hypothetical protein